MEKQISMVRFDQVSKIYERGGDTIIGLDQVSVEVGKGDFCAFIGPSGWERVRYSTWLAD